MCFVNLMFIKHVNMFECEYSKHGKRAPFRSIAKKFCSQAEMFHLFFNYLKESNLLLSTQIANTPLPSEIPQPTPFRRCFSLYKYTANSQTSSNVADVETTFLQCRDEI